MERWAKSVNAAKTQVDDSKKGSFIPVSKPEEAKSDTDVFKMVR